jgi:hypothetical protein
MINQKNFKYIYLVTIIVGIGLYVFYCEGKKKKR